jgi:dihydroorotase
VSFELFLADMASPFLVRTLNELLHALRVARDANAIVGITPGDDSVVEALTAKLERMPTDRIGYPRSRPPIAEATSAAQACLAVAETGVRAHIRQASCALTATVLRALAPETLTAEVTPHNLLLDEEEIVRQGPIAKVAPPLRPKADVLAMQEALRDRTIQIVATDHAPHLPEEKHIGDVDIWKAARGLPGVQTFLPLMLRLIGDGVITYPDLVRCCSEQPARVFGLYPQKGSLLPGADADIVIVDPNKPFVIRNESQQSKARLTPFDGWTAPATAILALQRGRIIMRDGEPVGPPAGRFVRPTR